MIDPEQLEENHVLPAPMTRQQQDQSGCFSVIVLALVTAAVGGYVLVC